MVPTKPTSHNNCLYTLCAKSPPPYNGLLYGNQSHPFPNNGLAIKATIAINCILSLPFETSPLSTPAIIRLIADIVCGTN